MNQWQYSYVLKLMMGHTCVLSIWTSTTYLGGLMLERNTFLVWFLSVFTTRASPLTISTTYIIKLFKSQFCEFLCNMFIMIILQQRINTQKIPCLRWYTVFYRSCCLFWKMLIWSIFQNFSHLNSFYLSSEGFVFDVHSGTRGGVILPKPCFLVFGNPIVHQVKKKFLIYAQITRGWY